MIYVNTELKLRLEGKVTFPISLYSSDGSRNEVALQDFSVHAEKGNICYDITDVLDDETLEDLKSQLIESEWQRQTNK